MVDISIVLVSWNCRAFVEQCLLSIRSNVHECSETILVDNASTDGTADFVRDRFPEVCVIASQNNMGFAKANNIGIRKSGGRYLALINPDVIVLPNCVGTLLRTLASDETIALTGPRMLSGDGSVRRSGMRLPTLWSALCDALLLSTLFGRARVFGGHLMHEFDWMSPRDVEVLNGWFWLVRREAIDDAGFLDERFFMYGEDVDWCKRFRDAGWRIVFEPEAAAVHYGGGSSVNSPLRFFLEMQRANLMYWRKHRSAAATFAYRAALVTHHLIRAIGYGALATLRPHSDARYKLRRSAACLVWLVTGADRTANPA